MNIEFCSGYGQYHSPSAKSNSKPLVGITWGAVLHLIDEPQKLDKPQAQWLIPSTHKSRVAKDQREYGQYWLLWADIDEDAPELCDLSEALKTIIGLRSFEIYTSKSATEDNPKARILIPLDKALTCQQWIDCQTIINDRLEEHFIAPDRVNERPSQLCYLPNDGSFYRSESQRIDSYFDPMVIFEQELKCIQGEREATAKASQLKKAIAEQKRVDRLNKGIESPIDWYNTTHRLESLLLEHGYIQRDDYSFTSPYSSSQSKSTNIDPTTGRVHSLSSSDPLFTNGQGAHDAYSAYAVLAHSGDAKEAWKAVSGMMTTSFEPFNDTLSPLDKLTSFSITGITSELRAQMLEDVYVLKGLAILGQWTAFYASPNTGKTLLTLWLLREQILAGELPPDQLFYVNADDAFRGAVEKAEIAKDLGFQMLVPGINNFTTKDVVPLMSALAEQNLARGAVIILDTLKKFTELMDKKTASEFGKVARMFVTSGGTLICLAHTNKNKDNDGHSVFAGTSDIVDDADCAYIIEGGEAHGEKLAEFRNIKARGDVEQSVSFSYEKTALSYTHLIDSIERVNKVASGVLAEEAERNREFSKDEKLIRNILGFISEEGISKTELVRLAMDDTAESRRKVISTLDKWCGDDYWDGHRWKVEAGEKNSKIYFPVKCPLVFEEDLAIEGGEPKNWIT